MAEPFLSPNWHRVARLKARLHPHAEITRHRARGRSWYSVRNAASGEMFRFAPPVYLLLGLLDGQRTVEQAWQIVAERLDAEAPTQDEVIRLLSQLHDADLLQTDDTPDFEELLARRRKRFWKLFWQRLGNPMALRFPLWDPDRFLGRWVRVLAPLPALATMLVWGAVVVPALLLAVMHWGALTGNLADRLLAYEGLITLALVFPVMKALHEMGHAVAVKAGGGAVHEMGVMFLVLLPIPYVDATAAGAFRSRWRRAGVGAAGMLVETFVAALALYLWLAVEPGEVRAVAYAVMVVAGLSTVLFNGNPLLRYDGYYILADLLGIPNLGMRATGYWGWLTQRVLFGHKVPAPATAPGEVKWLLLYAPASFICRLVVMAAIVLVIADRFFVIGVVIAIWTVAVTIAWPIGRALWQVFAGPNLARRRKRAVAVTLALGAALAGFVAFVPIPFHTVAEGVVWLPEQSFVRAGADGFVRAIVARPGERVAPGQLLFASADPDLAAAIGVGKARVAALAAEYRAQQFDDRVQAALTKGQMAIERSSLDDAETRARELDAYSQLAGRFVVRAPDDMRGRYFRRGEVLGYVLPADIHVVRVLVGQDDVELVRARTTAIAVRVANGARSYPARLLREVPGGSDKLPSKALSVDGGGTVVVDPRDQDQLRTLSRFFQFDIEIPPEAARAASGSHVSVRFEHGAEPLAAQAWRRIRQLLLSYFNA
jgi:putative peptide zinc metalloprotease protein